MKTAWLVVAVATVLGADKTTDEATKKELQKMQGEWTLESLVRDGDKVPEEQIRMVRRMVKENEYTVMVGDRVGLKGTFKIDPTKKPKTIDAVRSEGENKDVPMRGLYELEDDTYKVCFANPGDDRPTEFTSKKGTGHTLAVWKRVKKPM